LRGLSAGRAATIKSQSAVNMSQSAVKNCTICGKPQTEQHKPFCSRRCADVDLHRWFSGTYAIPAVEDEDDESSSPTGGKEPD
jgi:endogenous inhibitor of DNA gyrase (YacG/DUF329 family)